MADVLSRSALWLALSCTALAGCGAQFDPPTEVKSLRIMGVQKDKPYAVPGETVSLTMFWHDGSPKVDPNDPTARSVEIGWFGPCINPPYDSYAACGAALAKQQANDDPSDDLVTGSGERFALTIPDRSDLLHPSQDPKQPEYAVIYVFFAACAGKLGPSQDPSFPAGCYAPDDTGFARPLGSDDFVAGYSGIYVFGPEHGYRNQNPVIQGWVTQGDFQNDPSMVCLGDECLGSCDDPAGGELFGECHNASPIIDTGNPEVVDQYCKDHPKYCVPTCEDDADPLKCPKHDVHPSMERTDNDELDAVTNEAYGHSYGEQMWIDYYSSRGAMGSPTKLLNDATGGWNTGYGTAFFAPSTPGAVRVWAAVHDNRGGVAWAGTTLIVR
ncbi:MAG TPA: hypothetical protein VNN72_30465 [Polyangiaceae bacterium]|nr:hypothetical protein [Polyangiaceae bacterium]